MIVTGAKFTIIGEALAGPRFKALLALWLDLSERTIREYAAGRTNVPRPVRKQLAILCHTRGSALVRLAVELDPDVSKTAGKPELDKL